MKSQGIRIFDSKNNVLNVKISEILNLIEKGNDLNWCILFLDGIPQPEKVNTFNEYKNNINTSKEGFKLSWDNVCSIGDQLFQIYETVILGCENKKFLHRYNNDQEMYQHCDIVIELVDCAFWQIFSKNQDLIDRIKQKFNETELLEPNFE